MQILPWLSCFLVLCLFAFSACAAEKTYRVVVSARESDRRESVVSFNLPAGAGPIKALQDSEGRLVPVQIDANRQATFILKNLPKGVMKSYRLVGKSETSLGLVEVTGAGAKLKITNSGKPVLDYQAEPGELPRPDIKPVFRRGGYIHPVRSPSGIVVTDDFPRNHIHHHGIWFPWTKTEFEGRQPDFWNMGEGKGKVDFVALGQTWSGPVHGGFTTTHRFIDLMAAEPKAALNETWEVRVYKTGVGEKALCMFDLVSTQECASSSPLILPQYHYGGLGFRGNWQWNGKDKTTFLTSEGETDRVKGNETRGRWCHIGGTVDGQLTGIAILCHPDNFRAPQPMRLHPSEPFFCFAPSQLGSWEISPGKPYISRYRFIVQDGPPDKAELDRLWNDYAKPAVATIE
ncbi:MAG: hypothetical protein FJ403_03340 [Verrucomicrobia bacterium]|nr:hypothetical protein [Verrucomicrobiota bacterium]